MLGSSKKVWSLIQLTLEMWLRVGAHFVDVSTFEIKVMECFP